MEINLKELMNKVKTTAQSVGTKATEIGKSWMSTTKINFRIMELKSQIEADYKAAGKLLYAAHSGEEVDSDAIEEILAGIDGKNGEMQALKEQLSGPSKAAPAPAAACPVCGKPLGEADVFCPTCGTKVEAAEKAEEAAEKAEEAVEEIADAVAEKVEEAAEAAEDLGDEVKGAFEEVGEVIEETAEKAEEKFEDIVDDFIKEKDE